MMSSPSESVCRICLASDAPVRVIANSPLQEVYEKLTNVLLNTPPKPVAACSLCHWQLRKCHKLMTRCLIADELLTNILQTGGLLKEESISMISRVRNELRKDDLCCTPFEIIAIGSNGMEHNLIKTEVKEEPVSSQSTEEMEMDPSTVGEHLKSERSDDEADMALNDTQDVESQELIDEGNVKDEPLEGMLDTEDNSLLFQLKEESISMISRVRNELRKDDLCCTPFEILAIGSNGMEHNLIKTEVKEEPVSSQSTEEMEMDPSTVGEHLKSERSDDEAEMALDDTQDIESQELIDEGNVKDEPLEGMLDTEDNSPRYEEEHESEGPECMKNVEPAGAAPTEKCEQIHAEQTEHGSTLTPDDNNVQEKRTTRRTVIEEESPSRCVGRYILRSTRNVPNNRQVLRNTRIHSDTATNNSNVSVSSDNDCNTDVDNSSSKHVKKTFIFIDCGNMFDDKYLLIEHIEHHNVVKKNSNRCSPRRTILRQQSSSRTDVVNKQTETHSGKDPIQCEICQRRFTIKSHLTRHLRTHTGEKPFQCKICKSRFTRKEELNVHLRVHTGEKPFECEICKVRFSHKGHLNTHLLVHTGEKPFACEICKVRFSQKGDLNRHLRVHTGEKPFECEICKFRCSRKSDLKKHSKVHTGEKPFECEICKAKFARKEHLKRHFMVHTGEKLFACEICKVRFSQKGDLNRHLRVHPGEK